jgi:geranylgeranyl reductase family protein
MTLSGHGIYDIAVVGGGPAGTSAVLKLAGAGADVVLIEKKTMPRYKACGGGVSLRARALLNIDISDVVEREFYRATLTLLGNNLSFSPRRDQPLISMTMRAQLDCLLVSAARRAGAHIHTGTKVVSLRFHKTHVVVETTAGPITARVVIAADGVNSVLARQAGWKESRLLIPAIETELYVSNKEMERHGRMVRMDFDIPAHGYAWLFPKADHLSVGVLSVRRGNQKLNQALARYLKALGISEIEREERHGFLIPVRPRRDGFSRSRVMLVGDAAGFVDPVTAEGIFFAVKSGQLASTALIKEKFEWPQSSATYGDLIRKHITPELSSARLLASLLYVSPRVRTWIFRCFGNTFTEAIADISAGDRTYHGSMIDPMNYLKLLKHGPRNG